LPDEIIQVDPGFIDDNKKLCQTIPKSKKKGGPYSKQDKEARKEEVYRLHFEYGYSARKIAQLMKVNRNTINGDIDYWFSITLKKWDRIDPRYSVVKQMEILEIQKSRLRGELDKTDNLSERISIERLIFDIDSKIMQINLKLTESSSKVHELATMWLNKWMKKNEKDDRYITWFDVIRLSKKAHEKVNQIINEDRNNKN
jgi:hypothetical protein